MLLAEPDVILAPAALYFGGWHYEKDQVLLF